MSIAEPLGSDRWMLCTYSWNRCCSRFGLSSADFEAALLVPVAVVVDAVEVEALEDVVVPVVVVCESLVVVEVASIVVLSAGGGGSG